MPNVSCLSTQDLGRVRFGTNPQKWLVLPVQTSKHKQLHFNGFIVGLRMLPVVIVFQRRFLGSLLILVYCIMRIWCFRIVFLFAFIVRLSGRYLDIFSV